MKATILDILKSYSKGIWVSCIPFDGEFKYWWEEGMLNTHSFWKEGKEHGERKQWDKNGKLIFHRYYEKGKLIKDYLHD